MSVAVAQGMLAGIGLVLVAGQVYALGDAAAPTDGLGKIAGLGGLRHLDHACAAALEGWAAARGAGLVAGRP